MAFEWREEGLFCEGVSCKALADEFGTPLYVYSAGAFEERYDELVRAFSPANALVCFSVKACSNIAVLALLAGRGSGFDILSGGELHRVLSAGGDPRKVVFAGVGKGRGEIGEALDAGIRLFNVESEPELLLIDELTRARGVRANCAVRLNPDVDPSTHAHIATGKRETKFGLDAFRAAALFDRARELEGVALAGVHMHIGSQITAPSPYADAVAKLEAFVKDVRSQGHDVHAVDLGGGFGVMAADYCASLGLEVIPLLPETLEELNNILPSRWSHGNPVDASAPDSTDVMVNALAALARAENVDAIIHFGLGQAGWSKIEAIRALDRKLGQGILDIIEEYKKPVYPCSDLILGARAKGNASFELLAQNDIPVMPDTFHAARVLARICEYQRYLQKKD